MRGLLLIGVDLFIFLWFIGSFKGLVSCCWSGEHHKLKAPAAASSSDLPAWLICSLPALLFGHNSIPPLVCKTALSSQRGTWQQQIQSPSSQYYPQRPDLALLLRPVIKASRCLLLRSHQIHCEFLPCSVSTRENNPFDILCTSDFHSTKKQNVLLTVSLVFSQQVAGEQKYHPECFTCLNCRAFIGDGDTYALVERSKLYWWASSTILQDMHPLNITVKSDCEM